MWDDLSTEEKQDAEEIVEIAILKNGAALNFAGNAFRGNKTSLLKAIKSNSIAIEFVSDDLKDDNKFIMQVIQIAPDALSCP